MECVIALSPSHAIDVGVVIAASRAGGTGLIDLGIGSTTGQISSVLTTLRAHALPGKWGVRWDAMLSPIQTVADFKACLGGPVDVVLLAGVDAEAAAALQPQLAGTANFIALEVADLATARSAEAAGFHGVIIKGHEAGGWVGGSSSFILLQEFRECLRIPYWIQGGIGVQSATAAVFAGARGVVLGEQLWLTKEGPYAARAGAWSQLDGSETVILGEDPKSFRLSNRHGRARIKEIERAIVDCKPWRDLLRNALATKDDPVLSLGQDIAFAGVFARRFVTTGRAVATIVESLARPAFVDAAKNLLAENSDLAKTHGTRYPIVQGPMTRVSDVAKFAHAVATAGALPTLALSVMRGPQTSKLLEEAKVLLGDAPWCVGMLGFAPLDLRAEQIAAIRATKPPFAIIAGGRPNQARELEALGISTYLHVPSPALLKSFLKEGVTKFIFEGGECGGHTGPRSSFVLWESVIEILLGDNSIDLRKVQVLFAGGVHDAHSAAMVALMTAPIAKCGVKVGILMGTAYLFTREAVSTGAILEEFQNQALACQSTELLQSGVGKYTRCSRTAFCNEFKETRRKLLIQGKPEQEALLTLELLNVGRLRIASKGLARAIGSERDDSESLRSVDVEVQRRDGIYMMGEVARLRHGTIGLTELHENLSAGAARLLARTAPAAMERYKPREGVAIIGMACIMPGAKDMREFWGNILTARRMFREVPESLWRQRDFFDEKRAPDRIYSKWGAFIDEIIFDPVAYGIPPASLASIEPVQILALHVATQALADAGLDKCPFPKDRTATIFASGAMNELGTHYIFRTLLSHYLPKVAGLSDEVRQHIISTLYNNELPTWTSDSFPGIIANAAAGRVSNRLDLRGTNFAVDAACSSSLAALDVGLRQLMDRDADVALVGAIDGANGAMAFMSFAQTHALSPTGGCRPFSDDADGIVLGEGVGAMVLKRLSDAERDGDRIYAIIKGVGSSSDGRNRSMTAPDYRGQALAVQRAYEKAGVSPASVSLVEAHGTGTVVGDKCEVKSMTQVFGDAGAAPQSCALGSVKSMIGHTKVAAGLAAMVKASLALQHRVLPPTLGVEKPNSRVDFEETPFYLNNRLRPWFSRGTEPRRCGVSAFGFGGTNFHAVLEEYAGGYRAADRESLAPRSAELFFITRADGVELEFVVKRLLNDLEHPQQLSLGQLAYSLHLEETCKLPKCDTAESRLAIVATSVEDLKSKLDLFLVQAKGKKSLRAPQGVYYQDRDGFQQPGSVCMVFPGQGSQRVDMLLDIVSTRPESHALFERADELLDDALPQPPSQYVYPLPSYDDATRKGQQAALDATEVAQTALGIVDLTAYDLLVDFGLRPDVVAGHSFGEYVALCVAGALSRDDLIRLSLARGKISAEAAARGSGAMAAVSADETRVNDAIRRLGLDVEIANLNAPDQTVVAGAAAAIDQAIERLKTDGLRAKRLPVTAAFHCSVMANAQAQLAQELDRVDFAPPRLPVYSNTTADRYPQNPTALKALLAQHISEPLRFVDEIERIYADGVRVFVETGPGLTMSGLIGRILGKRPHVALAVDAPERPGWLQLAHLLAQASTIGLPVDVSRWFCDRGFADLRVSELLTRARLEAEPTASSWRVSGGKAVPCRPPGAPYSPQIHAARAGSIRPLLNPATVATITNETKAHPTDVTAKESAARLLNGRENVKDNHPEIGRVPPDSDHGSELMQMRSELAQFIDLQREQQVTMQRFLALQEQLLSGNAIRPDVSAPVLRELEPLRNGTAPPPARIQKLLTPSVPIPKLPDAVLAVGNGAEAPISRPAPAVPPRPSPERVDAATSPPRIELPPTADFKRELLATVVASTGYSEDMLDHEANMESDLGIDSIKRIEIFNHLKDSFPFMEGQDEEAIFDELASLKTLNSVVEWYDGLSERRAGIGGPDQPKKVLAPQSPSTTGTAEQPDIEAEQSQESLRYVLACRSAPRLEAVEQMNGYPKERLALIVGEASPLRDALAAALVARGIRILLLVPARDNAQLDFNTQAINFSTPDGLTQVAAQLLHDREQVGAIFNLAGVESLSDENWRRTDHARALFQLLKTFAADLKDSTSRGGGWLINVTSLDGQFGLGRRRVFSAAAAGTIGVAKCAVREWPALRVRCIDIDADMEPISTAREIIIEASLLTAPIEIGLTSGRRWELDLTRCKSDATVDLASLPLDEDSIVMVTGGANGITAEVARAIACAYRPRLILIGRSAPPRAESETTRRLSSYELKEYLIKTMRQDNPMVKPIEIERAYKRALKDREIRANILAMTAAGSKVEYHAMDVGDGESFAGLIDAVYERFGALHGIIHGSGVLDDGLIHDKTLDSFDVVYGTKVTPALILAEKLRPETLRFLFFFSSIVGRFGNAGQSDYSAANEVLNKLASLLSHKWPNIHTAAIGWGPWNGGMVTEDLRRLYAARGIETLAFEQGQRYCLEELARGDSGQSEVIVSASLSQIAGLS